MTQVGPFEVLGELGRGGMGVVLRALDRRSGEEVALKVLLRGALSERQRARFQREGELAARLDHPGIVKLFDAGQDQGRPYLAFERVHGRSLDEAFADAPLRQRVEWVLEVAEAVGYAHGHGVIHRDLKPSNVLIDTAGRARVLDFGLAAAEDQERLTQTGAVLGTPHYMAPEQFEGGRLQLDPRADVWSLGVLLYEALTNERPIEGDSWLEVGARVSAGDFVPPSRLSSEIPQPLERVCLRALQLDRDRRHPDAEALALDLQSALLARPSARRSVAPWVAVLGLGLAALLGYAFGRRAPAAPEPVVPDEPAVEPEDDWLARGLGLLKSGAVEEGEAALRRGAEAGSAEAAAVLADALFDREAYAEAVPFYEQAAEAGNDHAQNRVGAMYAAPLGAERDMERALYWFRRGAEQGNVKALNNLGKTLLMGRGEVEEGLGQLRRAAGLGHDESALLLGKVYANGQSGVPQDPREAFRWFARAAELGLAEGALLVGTFLEEGIGRAPDRQAALEAYLRAVELGSTRALYLAGTVVLVGKGGVTRDVERAESLLLRALEAGEREALGPLGVVSLAHGDPDQALALWQRGASLGDGGCMFNLSQHYSEGRFVPRDVERAKYWLQQSAEAGHPEGSFNWGSLLYNGHGVPMDPPAAVRFWTQAAESGDPLSNLYIGRWWGGIDSHAYQGGELPEVRDVERARRALARAIELGELQGWLWLGILEERLRNWEAAAAAFGRGAELGVPDCAASLRRVNARRD